MHSRVMAVLWILFMVIDFSDGFSLENHRTSLLKCRPLSFSFSSTRLEVAIDPLHNQQSQGSNEYNNNNNNTNNERPTRKMDLEETGSWGYYQIQSPSSSGCLPVRNQNNSNQQQQEQHRREGIRSAHVVEARLSSSLESLQLALSSAPSLSSSWSSPSSSKSRNATATTVLTIVTGFPTVRECNEALAAFGDSDDLLRALRMFGQMRRLIYLSKKVEQRGILISPSSNSSNDSCNTSLILPVPSLVTYSTLMSRAVTLHKPRVALRLWNLMTTTSHQNEIIPDVKAANILMNSFAKLANVKLAQDLLHEMKTGQPPSETNNNFLKGHKMTPNLVTINTLLNACQKAGDLDAALRAKQELHALQIRPDARTYTTLIATVARGPSQQAGKNDPTFAFDLLHEMTVEQGIQPNGMTYSALIDACGRCRRSDLALQGLRIMIRQKAQEQKALQNQQQGKNGYTLPNEVGAWTAAIDACGKCRRFDTAIKLFYEAMPKLGRCEPNQVTCGCLMDSLLRAGRTAETLDVLRYMKRKGIAPTEVMYTSLMTRAERLVQMEDDPSNRWSSSLPVPIMINSNDKASFSSIKNKNQKDDPLGSHETSGTRAIEVYTELMKSLVDSPPPSAAVSSNHADHGGNTEGGSGNSAHNNSNKNKKQQRDDKVHDTVLVKVFLVFRQMQALGAKPDIACYNALLQACARAGEFDKGMHILQDEILRKGSDLEPNDGTWRELLRAASRLKRSDLALQVWRQAIAYDRTSNGGGGGGGGTNATKSVKTLDKSNTLRWVPSMASFRELLLSFLRHAQDHVQKGNKKEARALYQTVVRYYVAIVQGGSNIDDKNNARHDEIVSRLDRQALLNDCRAMLLILQAVVALRGMYGAFHRKAKEMEQLSASILQLETIQEIRSTPPEQRPRLAWISVETLEKAESWLLRP